MSGQDTVYQQVREHLHTLGLTAAADRLAPALEAAERDKPGYTEFLADMLEHEVTALAERRLAGRLRFAKLPARKTLEQFDFSAQPSLDRRLIEDLATLRFVEEKSNILLISLTDARRSSNRTSDCFWRARVSGSCADVRYSFIWITSFKQRFPLVNK